MKILLVEDEASLGETIISYLKEEGYLCQWVKDFDSALEKASLYEYDCALIDITLPGGSGLGIVEALKKNYPKTGIIIISAKNSIDDKITGLDIGSDDYLTKPFHLAELNSRIKSVLRRRHFEGSSQITLGSMKLIPEQKEVYVNDMPVNLTKKEYDLLLFFVSNTKTERERIIMKIASREGRLFVIVFCISYLL